MSDTTRVLISGYGIAAQILAHWLAKTDLNFHITIIERTPGPRVNGQGIDIRDRAVDILAKMGVEQLVRDATTKEEGIVQETDAGSPKAYFPAAEGTGAISFTSDIEIQRGDLIKVLNTTIASLDLEYRFGTSIAALDEFSDRIGVTFDSGKVESFDLVVSAEGLGSSTRQLLQARGDVTGCAPGRPAGEAILSLHSVCALFTIPRLPSDSNNARVVRLTGGRVMLLRPATPDLLGACLTIVDRDRDDEMRAMSRLPVDEGKRLIRDSFHDSKWCEAKRVLDGLDESSDFYITNIAQVHLNKWSSKGGRVVLIGDAAYTPSPYTGRGTTAAIWGAYMLARALAAEKRHARAKGLDPDWQTACANYEREARPYIAECQKLLPGVPDLWNPRSAWGVAVLDTFVRLVALMVKCIRPVISRLKKTFAKEKQRGKAPDFE